MLALLRWLVAGGVATVVTLALFVAMTRLVDGSWILESIIRVFPLTQTELVVEEDCSGGLPLGSAVDIRGAVGFYRDGSFEPLPDARVTGLGALGNETEVEVNDGGMFRFATAFPTGEPTPCEHPPPTEQRLRVAATGCDERSVPVTPAWVPHRVLLDCPDR